MQRSTMQTLAKAVKAQAPSQVRLLSYTERQARLGRPVSPHVEIYAFPITALSSITNRVTGIAMSGGFAAVGALSIVGADVPALLYSAQEVIPFFAPVSKFVVAFPISYHFLCGARQAVWDNNPEVLTVPQAAPTSYALFGGAAVLGLGAAAITIKRE
ncbi:succinate dehydrogenase, cytochrome b556 subunit [Aphanomyces invadans]|nr:succinate dehydrogenase, cytochrome b556 subunit [Aphanomyces invadans]ETV96110.1 succinate dehydrogenase, cytochrome b556 subunit [Aphanomyces invadans]|eukprot:XP_008875421.1 succinate dehydrogenase, cytochrome b556 subunit [Aphanomyces invadans]